MAVLRALIYYLGITAAMLIFTPLSLLIYPFPYSFRYRIVSQWARFSLWWLRITCGIRFQVQGREHIPAEPAIIMCKHQSAWETMAVQVIFSTPLVFIMKRELLWIPLFGWGLATTRPIAIDRKNGFRASKQIVSQGSERLQSGCSVVVFPEGTRTAPGESRKYLPGGGMLAEATQRPVVPVAHNAGLCWPKNSFAKKPGTIQVIIGPPIQTRGKTAKEITQAAAEWIETTANTLN